MDFLCLSLEIHTIISVFLSLLNNDVFFQWVFLPEPPIRKKLVLPPPVKVDYRAACFCHRQLVDIGYVCSVCLSSKFSQFSSISV